MTKISVWVQSDKGRFQPGTAIVYVDGKVHARLRGEEGYEITISDPQISTSLRSPTVELSGTAAERAEEILDRRSNVIKKGTGWSDDPHGLYPLPDGPPEVEAARAKIAKQQEQP